MLALATGRLDLGSLANWMRISVRALVFLLAGIVAKPVASAEEQDAPSVLVLDQSGAGLMNPGYTQVSAEFRATLKGKSTNAYAIYLENLVFYHFYDSLNEGNLRNYLTEKYLQIWIAVIVGLGFELPTNGRET
jgi:hypothetical protein